MNVSFDAIADGLAEQGYAVADQFLNEQEVKAVLQHGDFNDARQRFKKAGIGQQQDNRAQQRASRQ